MRSRATTFDVHHSGGHDAADGDRCDGRRRDKCGNLDDGHGHLQRSDERSDHHGRNGVAARPECRDRGGDGGLHGGDTDGDADADCCVANSTIYTATVLSGASGVADASGYPLATDYAVVHDGGGHDALTVTGVISAAQPAASISPVTATFSEAMTAATMTTATFLLRDPALTTVPAPVAYDPATRTATLTPTAALAYSTIYTATVKSGAAGVKDAAGNALAADRVWSFTTGTDTTPPLVTSVTPASGATAIAQTSAVTATFNEAMTASTLTTATVLLRDPAATTIPATVTYRRRRRRRRSRLPPAGASTLIRRRS
jgi:hypothetical protein